MFLLPSANLDSVAEQSIIFPYSMYLDFFIVQDKDKARRDYKTFKPEARFIVFA